MDWDISHVLDDWYFEPGKAKVRRFTGKDGVEKLQMRIDLGILQMNACGRPDGKTPCGKPTYLDHLQEKQQRHEQENGRDESGFRLENRECLKLHQEAIQYHHRYICYFQLEDYANVIKDTDRNLAAISFAVRYAPSDESIWNLRQLTPQLLMMRTRATAAQSLEHENYTEAVSDIEAGIRDLRQFYQSIERSDLIGESSEIFSLEAWQQELNDHRPRSAREQLEGKLRKAVEEEDFEEAARYRDALQALEDIDRE